MTVYVIRDHAGNVHGVASSEPAFDSRYQVESFELDACVECGAEVALDCVCDD